MLFRSTTPPRESTTVVATYPEKTETTTPVKNETASIPTKTESTTPSNTISATETKTENTSTTTTITTPVKSQPSNPTNNPVEPNTQPASTSSANTSTVSADILKYYDALFDRLEMAGASYSASKPIPVDPPMPEGLIFKVQIGAFRNPIAQNLFKNIKPITAETTPQGLKRYTAGLFQKFSSANDAKTQINGAGYRDAFVVAFYNGKGSL